MMEDFPHFSTVLSAYASVSTIIMLLRTILNEIIPQRFQTYLTKKFSRLFSYFSTFTFIIEERWQAVDNRIFWAAQAYLPTKIGQSTNSLVLGSDDSEDSKNMTTKFAIPVDTTVTDEFEGMKVTWELQTREPKKHSSGREKKYFELSCHKRDREKLMQKYIPFVTKTGIEILKSREDIGICTYNQEDGYWDSTVFKHPSTFETLAMDPELKKYIINDLDTFKRRREYFESVGRAWKRGYLLYGPPGTGKSSLVAAIANYMRYDIYDLQFQSVKNDADLRKILTSTTNRSILLIEDIDCSTKVSHSRDKKSAATQEVHGEDDDDHSNGNNRRLFFDPGATLSGLLNFIDGLWSSCGDERIIIFTTNHKEKLDPALLRPGRMDVHIYMGHCTPSGFKKLVNSYLGIINHHLISSIEELLQKVNVTPAEVAQQLMESENPDVALQSLVDFITTKEKEKEKEIKDVEEQQKETVKRKVLKKNEKGVEHGHFMKPATFELLEVLTCSRNLRKLKRNKETSHKPSWSKFMEKVFTRKIRNCENDEKTK
ncbi:hypothetical protein ACFE04_001757 [Oxalis oulophora]